MFICRCYRAYTFAETCQVILRSFSDDERYLRKSTRVLCFPNCFIASVINNLRTEKQTFRQNTGTNRTCQSNTLRVQFEGLCENAGRYPCIQTQTAVSRYLSSWSHVVFYFIEIECYENLRNNIHIYINFRFIIFKE